jgi:opacity protein-like surface antigen
MYAFTNTTTSESNYYSSSSSSSSSSSVSFMYGAGVDLFLNESFAISADYIGSEIHHFGRVNIFSAGLKFAV